MSDAAEGVAPGRMEAQVSADLERMGGLDYGVRGSLAEASRILARAIDSYAAQPKTPAELSSIAKAIQELRTTLGRLVEVSEDEPTAGDTTPVWDATEPGPADAGAADPGGGPAAG